MDLKLRSASLLFLVIVTVQCHRLPGHHHRALRHEDSPKIVWETLDRGFAGCRRCPPEWGLVHKCNATHSTLCEPCGPGTWTPAWTHLEKCEPCSKCGEGLYIDRPCRPTHDTKCNGCESASGGFSVDFVRKCIRMPKVDLDGFTKRKQEGMKVFLEEEKANEDVEKFQLSDSDEHHQNWKFDDDDFMEEKIEFKPSFHDYESDGVKHEKRRIFILLGIAGGLLLILTSFGAFMAKNYLFGERIRAREQRLYVQLSSQDHQIINDCARKLAKSQPGLNGDDEEYWEDDPMKITDNPLESLYIHKTRRTLT